MQPEIYERERSLPKPVLIDPLKDARWDPFVDAHPYGTLYHNSSWLRVIRLSYRQLEPLAFILEDNHSRIASALPFCLIKSRLTGNRVVSLPFTSYCDPLVSGKEDFSLLLDAVLSKVTPSGPYGYYELRVLRAVDEVGDARLKKHSYHKLHLLDLSEGFEKVKASFHKDCIRKSIRKAVRSGITIRLAESEDDLKTYHTVHGLTRRKLGLPIQPYEFFKNMWQIMGPPKSFALLIAELQNRIIGGLIIFKYRDTVSMEHIGTDERYLLLRPNHLLYSAAIELACNEGFLTADFGKTTPDNIGLLDFKRRWGTKMYDVPYLYYPEIQGIMAMEETNRKYKLVVGIGRHMPFPLSRALGAVLYRHMG